MRQRASERGVLIAVRNHAAVDDHHAVEQRGEAPEGLQANALHPVQVARELSTPPPRTRRLKVPKPGFDFHEAKRIEQPRKVEVTRAWLRDHGVAVD